MIAQKRLTPTEIQSRLKSTIEFSCQEMKRASDFMTSVGKLMEAFANKEVDEEVFSPQVIGGLAVGLQIVSAKLWEEADSAEMRTESNCDGGAL